MAKLGAGTFAILLASAVCDFSALCAEQPPTLRLPDTVAPVGYRVELTLDPAKDEFSGVMHIGIKMTHAVETIWLNGTDITVSTASL